MEYRLWIKKLEEVVFYFFIFAIPISLRHIFGYSPIGFMEWKAISVYATDLLLIMLLVFPLVNYFNDNLLVTGKWKMGIGDCLLVALVVVAGISIRNAVNVHVAWYQWLKLVEGVALYFYVKNYALKRFGLTRSFTVFVYGGLFQAAVGVIQFISQQSIGLKYLGESPLHVGLTGIAAFFVNGIKVMRAYGTTPHPNVLATYLLVAIAGYWILYPLFKKTWWWHAVYALLFWGLLVTFSRTVIAIGAVFFAVWAFKEFKKYKRLVVLSFTVGVIFLAVYWPYVTNRLAISSGDEAVSLRVLYNHEVLAHGILWFGVGIGNFVPWLMTQALPVRGIGLPAEQYQPVHNIYLLIYAEMGLAGIALFFGWLGTLTVGLFRRAYLSRQQLLHVGLFSVLLIAGFFDHFLWTIQSGQLVFWLVAGLAASEY